ALARTSDVIASVTQDPALRAALSLHWMFYGTPPEASAFGVHALLARHYRKGAFYPLGGARSRARSFSAQLARRGGWVRTRAAGATETNRGLLDDARAGLWDVSQARPPAAYVAFPSLKDGVEHDGLHSAEVVAFTDWAPFAAFSGSRWRHRPAPYESLKASLA